MPGPGLVLQEGDVVHVIAEEAELSKIVGVFASREPGKAGH